MKMNQNGLDDYETPMFLFHHLDSIFNFECDAACTSRNSTCDYGFNIDLGQDGLKESWSNYRVFCNPPFSNKADWIKKAHDEVLFGDCPVCVMILPTLSMTTEAWHLYIHGKFFYHFSESRYAFIKPDTRLPDYNNNSGTTVVYFIKRLPKPLSRRKPKNATISE